MHRNGLRAAMNSGCIALLASALIACGGGGESAPSTAASVGSGGATGSGTSNTAPTIQGQPGSSALVGQAYSFQPVASDANGDALTFSVTNLPSWASFDPSTGRLSGTPAVADVATITNIRITVSDGATTAALGPFSIAVTQSASGSALLSWTPPAQNTDGTPLVDLAGYRVLYGQSAAELTQTVSITNSSLSSYLVENLTPGTWYFAVAAVNAAGILSNPSSVASKTIT